MLLAGDVGGTKTHLALYKYTPTPQTQKVYPSADFGHLEDIVNEFLQETGANVTTATFGVPGPVFQGVARITNLPWIVSTADLQSATNIPTIKLLNDLEATAYGVPFLPADDLIQLNDVAPVDGANKVIIAPGTGLGEAILFADEDRYVASASEGGHADFAPCNLFQVELLRYMMEKYEHVSYERVCSGIGIPSIYDYIRERTHMTYNEDVAAQIEAAKDPTPIIVQAGLGIQCAACEETINVFISILGAEAGNMALNTLAKGGVYLGGGIPPRIIDKLGDGSFMSAFINKGRFNDMLSRIPVYVIMNKETALFGAACYALGL